MKTKFSILLFVLAFTANSVWSQNRSIEFNHGTFSEILDKAKQENKMIFIDCYTTWCGPCKWMAKNVFTNDTVADFYNKNFINAKIDMETKEGMEIAKKYEVRNYPMMLYLNAAGEQLHRFCGSVRAASLIAIGEKALSPNTRMATFEANFNEGKVNAQFASTYFSMLANACQPYEIELNKYFATIQESEYRTRGNWEIIYKYVDDYYSKIFQTFETDKIAFIKQYGRDSVENKINQVYASGLYSAIQNKDIATYESIKTKLRKSNTKNAEQIILEADIKLYENNKEWTKYATSVTEYVNKYSTENSSELNNYAWAFYEYIDDKKMLANAEIWAKRATELDNNYYNNDTYAAVLYKLGKKSEAKIAAQNAINIAKKNGDNYKETELLLEKINTLK